MDLCNTADLNYKLATNKQFLIELTLVKLCQLLTPATAPSPQPIKPLQPQTPPQTPPQASPQTPPQVSPQTRPASPPRPTSAPAPAPAPTPAVQRTSARSGLPSFSIKGNQPQQKAEDTGVKDDSHPAARDGQYTPEQLKEAWMAFVEAHPTERILINTMKAGVPVKGDGDRYVITVDDTMQVDAINESKAEILNFVRDRLQNDSFDFDITMRTGEASPITWTQREVLGHMVEKHPQIREFIEAFSLTL